MTEQEAADVAVIGAGVVGLFIAYRLSRLGRRVVVIDKQEAPGMGVTAGQATVIHVVQLPFGSVKSKLARRGNVLYDEVARELGVKLLRVPSLIVTTGWVRLPALFAVWFYLRLELRGDFRVQLMRGKSLRKLEPLLADGITGGIIVHGYGTIDVSSLVSSLADATKRRGATLKLRSAVTSAHVGERSTILVTTGGDVRARCVVNAAGLYSDEVAKILGRDFGNLEPGLGVMAVYTGLGLKSIVAPLPLSVGARTKGGAIIPATDGTVIMGPTLRVAASKEDSTYTDEDLELLNSKFGPLLNVRGSLLRAYTGVRPMSPTKDFVIDFDRDRRVINLVGIESPGLTAAPAIADMVVKMVEEALS
jgi:glycerol-3-phosphate dehydrogenase